MLFHHLTHLVNCGVAVVLADLEREISPSALRDLTGAGFKGVSIYRADPFGANGIPTSQLRPLRNSHLRTEVEVLGARAAVR
jgi:hypothetical protein